MSESKREEDLRIAREDRAHPNVAKASEPVTLTPKVEARPGVLEMPKFLASDPESAQSYWTELEKIMRRLAREEAEKLLKEQQP